MFALVDCNNFYASCERVFNPALRLRPVVVLSNNDGCIIARSEEPKALGIQMGMPEFKCRPMLKAAQTMLDGLFRAGMSYKKAGVMVSGIVPKEAYSTTLSLFAEEEPAENERESKIMQVMDAINQRYGSGAVRLAAENSESWKPHQERLSARYTTRWDDIIEVDLQ